MDDHGLGTPKSGKVAAAAVDVDRCDAHAVDVDDGELDGAVVGLLPENVAG